jgi:hypothetical protein
LNENTSVRSFDIINQLYWIFQSSHSRTQPMGQLRPASQTLNSKNAAAILSDRSGEAAARHRGHVDRPLWAENDVKDPGQVCHTPRETAAGSLKLG